MVSIRSTLSACAVTITVGACLALGGCAQSMSEFAQAAAPGSSQSGPLMLEPQTASAGPTIGNGVARPAVLVEETTVPAPKKTATNGSAPPLPPADATATAYSAAPATDAYPNINLVPDQPKGKLLSPEEKARVIAELEALAKGQVAGAAKNKNSAKCATENVKPADRLKGETGSGEC